MKELITTQLIEEYQKHKKLIDKAIYECSETEKGIARKDILYARRKVLSEVITSLQSKQSEERQNIVIAFSKGIQHASGMEQTSMEAANHYLKETFKQEQK